MIHLITLVLLTLLVGVNCQATLTRPPRETTTQQTYVLIGTNDIHGSAYPTQLMRTDNKERYTYGGVPVMASLIDIVKKQYGANNVLYLDGGDQFQGTIEASRLVSSGKIMNDYYNAIQVATTAIGNHQFDFGPSFLDPYLKGRNSGFVAANIYSPNDEPVETFLSNTKRTQMFTLDNNFKVGVIGLTTIQTLLYDGFVKKLFPTYKFKDYVEIVTKEAQALRDSGANAVVIVAHEGNKCPGQSLQMNFWNKDSNQIECPSGPIVNLIDSLPTGTIDAVVQGHEHKTLHAYRKGVPIIGNINGGFYLNLIYLTVDKQSKKIVNTLIEGPVPVCEKVFSKTKRCTYVQTKNLATAGDLVNWKFHDQDVKPNTKVQALLNAWSPQMAPYSKDIVLNEAQLTIQTTKESQLGNLLADLYLKAAKGTAHFSVINPGSARISWYPGIVLQYQHVYKMFPYDNTLQTFAVTGKQLKQMFAILQAGKYGFYPAAGLDMTVSLKTRALLNIATRNQQEIKDDAEYIGVTNDFMLGGGDDMKNFIGKLYTPRKNTILGPAVDLIIPLLAEMKVIKQNTLIDPNHPRLVGRDQVCT